jgi:hypothetical protein
MSFAAPVVLAATRADVPPASDVAADNDDPILKLHDSLSLAGNASTGTPAVRQRSWSYLHIVEPEPKFNYVPRKARDRHDRPSWSAPASLQAAMPANRHAAMSLHLP